MLSRKLVRLLLVLLFWSAITQWPAPGGERKRRDSRTRTPTAKRSSNPTSRNQDKQPLVAPSSCYKQGADLEDIRLDFVNTGFQWPQPGGRGSDLTITYSYSNLLDGRLQGLAPAQIKQAVEESLAVWASVAPLHFVEVEDSGPAPTQSDPDYAATASQIRLGHHVIDGASGAALAHAFLPFSTDSGIAGDVHFDRDEDWGSAQGGFFLETALHEVGHSLGLDREIDVEAIMNPVIVGRFGALGEAFLLEDDINGIRDIYGEGVGSITPLGDVGNPPDDQPNGDDEPNVDDEPNGDPAGVTATFDQERDAIVIAGDAEANSVLLVSSRWMTAVVGLDATSINGMPFALFFGNSSEVDCQMGSGDDSVWTFGFAVGLLDCQLGEGDDSLVILFSWIEDLLADGGSGSDLLIRLGNQITNSQTIGFE